MTPERRRELETRIRELEAELAAPPAGLAGAALAARRGRIQRDIAAARVELANPRPPAPLAPAIPTVPPCPPPIRRRGGWGIVAAILAVIIALIIGVSLGREVEIQYPSRPVRHRQPAAVRPTTPAAAPAPAPTAESYMECVHRRVVQEHTFADGCAPD